MKSAIIHMREYMSAATASEQNLLKYMLENLEEVCDLSIRQLAVKSYTSPSTVVRLCKNLEFEGYKDFQKNLLLELSVEKDSIHRIDTAVTKEDTVNIILNKVFQNDIQSIKDTQKLLDHETLEKCIKLIVNAERILLYGMGASFNSAKDLYLKLLRLNKTCTINEDWHAQLLSALNSTPKDIAIVFSYSGQTNETITCSKALKENNTPIIAITRYTQNPIQDLSDFCLFTASGENIVRTGAMTSRISQLVLIDVLYTCLVNAEWDFALKQINKTHINKSVN